MASVKNPRAIGKIRKDGFSIPLFLPLLPFFCFGFLDFLNFDLFFVVLRFIFTLEGLQFDVPSLVCRLVRLELT